MKVRDTCNHMAGELEPGESNREDLKREASLTRGAADSTPPHLSIKAFAVRREEVRD
jgi:hypothetical protein